MATAGAKTAAEAKVPILLGPKSRAGASVSPEVSSIKRLASGGITVPEPGKPTGVLFAHKLALGEAKDDRAVAFTATIHHISARQRRHVNRRAGAVAQRHACGRMCGVVGRMVGRFVGRLRTSVSITLTERERERDGAFQPGRAGSIAAQPPPSPPLITTDAHDATVAVSQNINAVTQTFGCELALMMCVVTERRE